MPCQSRRGNPANRIHQASFGLCLVAVLLSPWVAQDSFEFNLPFDLEELPLMVRRVLAGL